MHFTISQLSFLDDIDSEQTDVRRLSYDKELKWLFKLHKEISINPFKIKATYMSLCFTTRATFMLYSMLSINSRPIFAVPTQCYGIFNDIIGSHTL